MTMSKTMIDTLPVRDILIAHQNLKDVVVNTPLQRDQILSERYEANVYLKREDLQIVRSFKLRGAYHFMMTLSDEELQQGVVCASAGNHAQGVAYACKALGVRGKIFMPTTTPRQKVSRVEFFGEHFVEVILHGDTFDDAFAASMKVCTEEKMTFMHPFDDVRTIAGQGTVGMEILEGMDEPVSHVFMSVGGGGLISGVGSYIKNISPHTKLIGVEPAGAPSMTAAIEAGEVQTLEEINKFVDGASVKSVGKTTFQIARRLIDDMVLVDEGEVCSTILSLYNEQAIVAEPAGALSVSALEHMRDEIKGQTVVCIVSGGNNDIDRMQEIKERSMIYDGYKHYFIVNFPQRAGALRQFMAHVLGENDDITRFEYTKKNDRDKGPVLVGIELKYKEDYHPLVHRMEKHGFDFLEINQDQKLFNLLI
ncbi:threonine ammonia-lyase IlvA [Salisediminibacterium beveridgei]|uniref:L-threonine dehydratase n=1 Tax=Salisediminibacterium beveridgei TaxID=632773 RepID=A0A1D7QVH6_9BACI|nr:threonine ammonia-lyase IlvA [Salisediminibacterium beveridgei]AOM83012.1 Threonine dehydratase biosynthetic [Salisediminibacterium beveridgei]